MINDEDLPSFLASWSRRYPFPQGWVDDDANAACRRSEAAWLRSLRAETDAMRVGELVSWRFHEPRQLLKPMQAVSAERWPATKATIEKARKHVEEGSDDLEPLLALDEIYGWGIPMASALLMAWSPERFIVADGRIQLVLRAIRGHEPSTVRYFREADWIPYLQTCREILGICQASSVEHDSEWTFLDVARGLLACHDTVKQFGVYSAESVSWGTS